MSDAGDNFISGQFQTVSKNLNIEQAVSSSYHYQNNGQVGVCIKFIKWPVKNCFDTKSDPHISLLQMRSTQLGPGLPSPATLLFNHPIRCIMPIHPRLPLNSNNNKEHYKALINRVKNDKNLDTPRNNAFILIGSTVTAQHKDAG